MKNLLQTGIGEVDRIGRFGLELQNLPPRHVRRLGLLLAQAGMLLTAASFCVSIAGMNIGVVAALIGCVLAQAPLHRAVGAVPMALYLAWLAWSTLIHHEFLELARTAIIPFGLVLAQVALHPAVPGAVRLRQLIAKALVLAMIAALLLALGQFLVGRGGKGPFRIAVGGESFSLTSGFFGSHQNHGGVMAMLCLLITGVAAGLPRSWRWIALGSAAIATVISGSRAALFGLVAATSATVSLRGRRFFIIGVLAGALVLLSGLVTLRMVHPGRFERLVSFEDGRWAIWRASIQVAKDHPLSGTGGTRAFQEAYREVYPRVVPDIPSEYPRGSTTAHNTHLSHVAEHGIPLAVLWLATLVVPMVFLWRRHAGQPAVFRAGVGLVVAALVYGQFEKVDEEPERVLWAGLGILVALSRFPADQPARRTEGLGSRAEHADHHPVACSQDERNLYAVGSCPERLK